jgi:hypothetical protein
MVFKFFHDFSWKAPKKVPQIGTGRSLPVIRGGRQENFWKEKLTAQAFVNSCAADVDVVADC